MKTPSVEQLERPLFTPAQERNENQDDTDPTTPSAVRQNSSQDHLLISEKGENKYLYTCIYHTVI